MTGVVVTLTDSLTDVSGNRSRQPRSTCKDYVLVISPRRQQTVGRQSRYVRNGAANQDGNFSIKGLPPAHLATVLESARDRLQNDPALLELTLAAELYAD